MSLMGDGLLLGHYPAGEVEPAGRGRRGRFFGRMSPFRFDAEQPSGAVRGKDLGLPSGRARGEQLSDGG